MFTPKRFTAVQAVGAPLRAHKSFDRRLKDAIKYRLYRQSWNIAAIPSAVAVVAGLEGVTKQRRALESAQWMPEESGLSRADPFPRSEDDGTVEVLFEQLKWSDNRGKIARAVWDGARFSPASDILDLPHHLSYPFLVEGGFVPEQSVDNAVKLYRKGPDGFECTSLMEGLPIVDPTLFRHDDKWWMFATHLGSSENSELHLYYADGITGPWTAHPCNPIVSNASCARPAGSLFLHHGEIFRPAQNCQNYYGESIAVCRIIFMTSDFYAEEVVSEIQPLANSRYSYGLHTLAGCEQGTVIDGARLESVIHPKMELFADFIR